MVGGGGSCFHFPVYAGVYLCLFVYQKYFLLHIAPARWYVVVAVCLLFFCVFLYSLFCFTRVALARWYVEVAVVLISLYMLVCI